MGTQLYYLHWKYSKQLDKGSAISFCVLSYVCPFFRNNFHDVWPHTSKLQKNGLGFFIPLCIIPLCSIFRNRTSGNCFRAGGFFMVKKCRLTMTYSHESNSIRSLMSPWISCAEGEQKPPEIVFCSLVYFKLLGGFASLSTWRRHLVYTCVFWVYILIVAVIKALIGKHCTIAGSFWHCNNRAY